MYHQLKDAKAGLNFSSCDEGDEKLVFEGDKCTC